MSPRHVPASAAELQRVGLFGSLPGETIAKLAGRMVREAVPGGPGDRRPRASTPTASTCSSRGSPSVTQEGRGDARRAAAGRDVRRGGAADADGANGDRHRDDDVRRRELRPGDVRRAAAAALRLGLRSSSRTTASESAGQATFAQSPNSRVVSAAQATPAVGVDPEERAAAAEVPEGPRRGERARPVTLLGRPSARPRDPSRAG